jgi:hypothetical protein
MRYVIVAAMGLLLAVAPALSQQEGHLQPGSDPSVLPGPVLIADEDNDRIILVDPQGRVVWTFPEPGDLRTGETFKSPDDAFYTADGKQIIVTHEENFAVSLVDIASRRIVWRYGTPGVHGHGPNQLWNPDDALVLPDGHVLIRIVWQYGQTGRRGREPGLLNTPDGVDLAPPHSLLIVHKATMGTP